MSRVKTTISRGRDAGLVAPCDFHLSFSSCEELRAVHVVPALGSIALMGYLPQNKVLVKPSGKLVLAKDNAKSIRSMSAMLIAPWNFWGAPAATTTCRDGYQGRLPAAHLRTKPLVLFPITGFSNGRPQLACSGAERYTPLPICAWFLIRSCAQHFSCVTGSQSRSNPVPKSNLHLPPFPVCEVFHIRDAGYCSWL
jgi:hypothetical protein